MVSEDRLYGLARALRLLLLPVAEACAGGTRLDLLQACAVAVGALPAGIQLAGPDAASTMLKAICWVVLRSAVGAVREMKK